MISTSGEYPKDDDPPTRRAITPGLSAPCGGRERPSAGPGAHEHEAHRRTEWGTQMTIELLALEFLALAAVATWLVLLPMRAVGRLGPLRGRLRARPAARPVRLAPAFPEISPAPQRAVVTGMAVEAPAVEMPVRALGGAELVGAGHR